MFQSQFDWKKLVSMHNLRCGIICQVGVERVTDRTTHFNIVKGYI